MKKKKKKNKNSHNNIQLKLMKNNKMNKKIIKVRELLRRSN